MNRRIILYPYKMSSSSCKALQDELLLRGHKVLRVYPNRRYKPRANDLVINWGFSDWPEWRYPNMPLNLPQNVRVATHKQYALEVLENHGVIVPEFTTSAEEVYEKLTHERSLQWFARTKLQAKSGEGIVPIYGGTEYGPEGDTFPRAPLYTKYIKKSDEYRVHVFKGEVIDVQQKRKRQEVPNKEVNYQIRNAANGWVFCREGVDPDYSVLRNSLGAISALGLDFGAVDVIWNEYHRTPYILEVNTAPGLEGSTVIKYADKIEELL